MPGTSLRLFVAMVVLLAACGRAAAPDRPAIAVDGDSAAGAAVSPSIAISSTPPGASPSAGQLPGSVVRVTVNGVEETGGLATVTAPGPAAVVLWFPFAVDRGSVEPWLPSDAPRVWLDDRTLRLTIPESDVAGFKIPQTRSADGASTIGLVVVHLSFPPHTFFRVFEPSAILSGGRFPQPTLTHRLPVAARIQSILSPDGRTLLVLNPTSRGPVSVAVVAVDSGATRPLVLPPTETSFVFAGWLADGRILLVGKNVWLGDAHGTAVHAVADTVTASGRPDAAQPSSRGLLALSYSGRIVIQDLQSGRARQLASGFHPCATSSRTSLAWSLGGTRLAGTGCDDAATPERGQVRILDVAADRTVAVVGAGAPTGLNTLSTFPTGELLLVGPSDFTGEGAPWLGIVMSFDGTELRRYLGASWLGSPNGRYLLQMEPTGGAGSSEGTAWTLIETSSGRRATVFLPWHLAWLPDGRIAGW